MALGGFNCSKQSLIVINFFYIAVAILLISLATYARQSNLVTSVPIVAGITACGGILFFIAFLGLIGASKHNQVMLFFYMVILFILFIVQFAIACTCLAVNHDQQYRLASTGWNQSSNATRQEAQEMFDCCGFDMDGLLQCRFDNATRDDCLVTRSCCAVKQGKLPNDTYYCNEESCGKCDPCYEKLANKIESGATTAGWVGLGFSLTEAIGFYLTYEFRKMINPVSGEMVLMH